MPLELDGLKIEKYTEIVIGIYNRGEILEELSRGTLVMMPKNVGGNECELYQIISLIKSSVTCRIIPEIGQY